MSVKLVPVRARDCTCPGRPHEDEGDVVYVTQTLSLAGGLEAREDIRASLGSGKMLAERWLTTFVKHGAKAWNLLDEDGDAVPFDVEDILADIDFAEPVAEKCDELYGETVTRPLVENIKKLSRRGPTGDLTSATSGTSKKARTSSRKTKATPSSRRSSPRSTAGAR